MLVITRTEGEEVVIGNPSNPIGVIKIASIRGERVRIGFDFPRDVDIHRREVADEISRGNDRTIPEATGHQEGDPSEQPLDRRVEAGVSVGAKE